MPEENGRNPEQRHSLEAFFKAKLPSINKADALRLLQDEIRGRGKAKTVLLRHGARLGRQVLLLYDLLRDWRKGRVKVPWKTISAVTAALVYFLNPLDIVPDFMPAVGYLDDATVVTACIRLVQSELKDYALARGWELKEYSLN